MVALLGGIMADAASSATMPRERSAAAKVLLLLLRPVMWILGSDLWAFNVLCLGYAYCVWTGVFGSNLAWLVGKLLGTIAFVAAVSTKLFETPTRGHFRQQWRRENDIRHGFESSEVYGKPPDADAGSKAVAADDWEFVDGSAAKKKTQ